METALSGHGGLARPGSRLLLRPLGDERLVEQLRRGNQVAFEVIFDRHHRGILSFCRHMLGSREEAEDAVQQTFLSAYKSLVETDNPVSLKAWLYTIARNRCLTMLRARREEPSEEIHASTAGLSEDVQRRSELRELVSDLGELPEHQRAALVLSQLDDLSHEQIARVLGCETRNVKAFVYQARASLLKMREAREISCEEVREEVAGAPGGKLRGPVRSHLESCAACREFQEEVRRQRGLVAAVLPVVPTLGLKEDAMAAVGLGSAGGASAGGGVLASLGTKAGLAKVAATVAVVSGVAGGGYVAIQKADEPDGARRDSPRATSSVPGDRLGADRAPDRSSRKPSRGERAKRAGRSPAGADPAATSRGASPTPEPAAVGREPETARLPAEEGTTAPATFGPPETAPPITTSPPVRRRPAARRRPPGATRPPRARRRLRRRAPPRGDRSPKRQGCRQPPGRQGRGRGWGFGQERACRRPSRRGRTRDRNENRPGQGDRPQGTNPGEDNSDRRLGPLPLPLVPGVRQQSTPAPPSQVGPRSSPEPVYSAPQPMVTGPAAGAEAEVSSPPAAEGPSLRQAPAPATQSTVGTPSGAGPQPAGASAP